jgi:ubiquinone biosynthesis protein UbiJ
LSAARFETTPVTSLAAVRLAGDLESGQALIDLLNDLERKPERAG